MAILFMVNSPSYLLHWIRLSVGRDTLLFIFVSPYSKYEPGSWEMDFKLLVDK